MALLNRCKKTDRWRHPVVDSGFVALGTLVPGGLNRGAALSLLVPFLLFIATGCSNTVNEAVDGVVGADGMDGTNGMDVNQTVQANNGAINNGIVGNPSSTEPVELTGNSDFSQPSDSQNSAPQVDQSGIANSSLDLAQLLLTDFVLENDQFVPTTGWICTDTIDQQRIYYFYPQGLLDPNRSVAIERTLNANNTLNDLAFFWSVTASDAIVMTATTRESNGMLLSAGQQYDVNSIRFQAVDSVQTFVAETVLRGRLVCGNFALR